MQVRLATSAANLGQANEDFVGAVPNAAVLLDGAGIPGADRVCRHGVAWYTRRLGATLLTKLSNADGRDLAMILSQAIDQVTGDHRGTCDVADPISPSSTVVMVRIDGDHADYLVLGDSFLLLDRVGAAPSVVTDARERDLRQPYLAALDATVAGTSEHDHALDSARTDLRALRNRPGGFWLAKDDPHAAAEALTGRESLGDLASVALLSNGASRIVDLFGLTDWPGVLAVLGFDGPSELIRRVRRAEEGDPDIASDDATVAYCTELETP